MSVHELPFRQSTSAFILNERHEVLLVQLTSYATNEWNLPGGGVDTGETPVQAVLRELNEELGLKSSDLTLRGESQYVNKYTFAEELSLRSGFAGQEKYQFVFTCASSTTIAIQPEEISRYEWVHVEELPSYLGFPGQLENAEKVLREFELTECLDGVC